MLRIAYRFPGGRYLLRNRFCFSPTRVERELFGIKFQNPVGLAAGFDKDAKWFNELACLGFGFVEIGTATPWPQSGNERPRLFRLIKDEAIVNRMGFNNAGARAIADNLRTRNEKIIIGGNIGKNKMTANENALDDYVFCFEALYDAVDYFVVNVSSPNTPGLRELQDKAPLTHILTELMARSAQRPKQKPILLKIAPDLAEEQLDDIIELVKQTKIAGVVATNTTTSRSALRSSGEEVKRCGAGGLSGKPLAQRSTEVIRYIASRSNKSFSIIGVGGIHSANDALEKLKAGADLVQLYTGFIYEGPGLVRRICKAVARQHK